MSILRDIFGLTYALLIIFIAGKALVDLILVKDRMTASLRYPLYFMIGCVVLSLYMLILSIIHIQLSVPVISAPFLVYMLVLLSNNKSNTKTFFLSLSTKTAALIKSIASKDFLFKIVLFTCFASVLVVLFENLFTPIYLGDAHIHWFFKAKAIYMTRTVPMDILTNNLLYYSALDYPLGTSFCVAWESLVIGHWSETITKMLFTVQYVCLLAFMFGFLRSVMNERLALFFSFITANVPHLAGDITTGYVDVTVGVYAGMAVMLLCLWRRYPARWRYLLLSGTLMGGAAWTKNEGIVLGISMLLTIIFITLGDIKNDNLSTVESLKRPVIFLIPFTLIIGPFKMLIMSLGVENHMISSASQIFSLSGQLFRVPIILNYAFYEFFLDTYLWSYFWIFLILILFFNRKGPHIKGTGSIAMFISIFAIIMFYVYMITYLGRTPAAMLNNLELSLDRVMLDIVPACGALLACSFIKRQDTE